jgi:Arc/MetJ-type ribon-helix-helix transcriptional regulator
MTVRTTLSFTDRHHGFLVRKVEEGVFASTSAAVAAAVEAMIEDETARETALAAMAEEIRARAGTPAEAFLGVEDVFAELRGRLGDMRKAGDG